MSNEKHYFTLQEASQWATKYLGREVTTSNISYLIQYGRIKKYGDNHNTQISKQDLIKYYQSQNGKREIEWKNELGEDLNWALSFDNLTEKERTKHVHRLHPYKGKFIPQLVEYFLDSHTDDFKTEIFFKPGDIILDPFCGSGTALVQANELNMHALGIDISAFNAMISNIKIGKHNLFQLSEEIRKITIQLKEFVFGEKHTQFEAELSEALTQFNNQYFPSPEFIYRVRQGEIDQMEYGHAKEKEFQIIFDDLVNKYDLEIEQEQDDSFLDRWYIKPVRDEIEFAFNMINNLPDGDIKNIMSVILSRTMRSCRVTTHADLATLVDPVFSTYYCRKHGKICKPLFSILGWWERYSKDTLKRLAEFKKLRSPTYQYCFTGDSRTIDIFSELSKIDAPFYDYAQKKKISGIFSSPPYVGLIDYHEQHAYAYDLFKFKRKDDLEIGPLYKGQGREAREMYVEGIAEVLRNAKRFLQEDYHVFLVSNDKYGLYPIIAEKAGMAVVHEYKRPVLYRTEKNKMPYAEKIFHLKEK
jgi:hypothetical protein